MKRALNILLFVIFSLTLRAQSAGKPDLIVKINGDELSGKVIEMNDNDMKFSHTGETLVYTIKKADILKITYSSGRTEIFNKTVLTGRKHGCSFCGDGHIFRKANGESSEPCRDSSFLLRY